MVSTGTCLLKVPSRFLAQGRGVKLTIKARHYFPSETWLRVDKAFDQRKKRLSISNAYNSSGSFVTVNGYEYTSWLYGHRNVYSREDHPPMFPASPNQGGYAREPQVPPEGLWAYLREHAGPFITVPHHITAAPHPFCWERFDSDYDANVEIFSGWGSSESMDSLLVGDGSDKYPHLTVREALKKV